MYTLEEILEATRLSFDCEFAAVGEIISIRQLDEWISRRRKDPQGLQLAYSEMRKAAHELLCYQLLDIPCRHSLLHFLQLYNDNNRNVRCAAIAEWLCSLKPVIIYIVFSNMFYNVQPFSDRIVLDAEYKVGVDIAYFRHIILLEKLHEFLNYEVGDGVVEDYRDDTYVNDAKYKDPDEVDKAIGEILKGLEVKSEDVRRET